MKNKSKSILIVLAAALLLLSVPTSAFAVETDQEIGVPQPMEVRAKGCFGVVLSPDGDGFYSVRDGLITHYQIEPFMKLGSVSIEQEPLKGIPDKESCSVLITDDGSRLILVFRDWIVSLDRGSGKTTKKSKREAFRKDATSVRESVTINENELVILSQFMEGPEENSRVWFYLSVLDVNTFSFNRPALDIVKKFEFQYSSCCIGISISKIQNRLYLTSGRTLAVLNSKTYEPELTLNCPRDRTFGRLPAISKDYQELYAVAATFVNDYLTKTKKDYGEPKRTRGNDFVLIFDQATRQFSLELTNQTKEGERLWRRDLYDPALFGVTRTATYVVGQGRIRSRKENIDYYFYQFESGEAILKEDHFPDRKMTYHLTPNARQYLMMKNHEGKVVPINDATFEKYRANSAR